MSAEVGTDGSKKWRITLPIEALCKKATMGASQPEEVFLLQTLLGLESQRTPAS